MATSTRISEDQDRIKHQMHQMTGQMRWTLDVPGNGSNPDFLLSQAIIPQKWGGNLYTNSIDVGSALLGLQKRVGKDCQKNITTPNSKLIQSPVDESSFQFQTPRDSNPAWELRNTGNNYWQQPLLYNEPSRITVPFSTNENTREKIDKSYRVCHI